MQDKSIDADWIADFDEEYYLSKYNDVAKAVSNGFLPSGLRHFIDTGYAEGRIGHRTRPLPEPRFHLISREMANGQKKQNLREARTILVQRSAQMGDLLMTTPVLARLRHLVGPETRIDVSSLQPKTFAGNPHINYSIDRSEIQSNHYEYFIDLDQTYEKNLSIHAVDAYMLEAFGDSDWCAKNVVLIKRPLPADIEVDWHRAVTLHPALTSRNRTIPAPVWEELIGWLEGAMLVPVILGSYREVQLGSKSTAVDLTAKLTLQQTATAIQSSLCFVSADTGLSHVAGSTDTPMVTIYTAVPPRHRLPWRYGQLGWRVTALVPDLDCAGCYGGGGCRRLDYACVEGAEAITAERIFNEVVESVKLRDHTRLIPTYRQPVE